MKRLLTKCLMATFGFCLLASPTMAAMSQDQMEALLQKQAQQIQELQNIVKQMRGAKVSASQQTVSISAQDKKILAQQIKAEVESQMDDSGLTELTEQGDNLEFHGFISQGYLNGDYNYFGNAYGTRVANERGGTFDFAEAALNVNYQFADDLRVGMQLLSTKLGENGDYKIKLDWAYADWSWKQQLGVRLGRLKKPKGLYNQERDVDLLRTAIVLPQSVYNEGQRPYDTLINGIGIYGSLDASSFGSFDYELMTGALDVNDDQPVSNLFTGSAKDPNLAINFFGSNMKSEANTTLMVQWNTPLEGLRLRDTYSNGKVSFNSQYAVNDKMDYKLDYTNVFSAEYTWEEFVFVSEVTHSKNTTYGLSGIFSGMNGSTRPFGWYSGVTYQINDEWQLGSYYSEDYSERKEKGTYVNMMTQANGSVGWMKDMALTLRYDINANWLVKLEAHYMNGLKDVDYFDGATKGGDKWQLYGIKTTVSF